MNSRDEALSILGWWELAGVDVAIDEAPRDWLAAPRPVAASAVAPMPVDAPPALPATIEAMHAFLATAPIFGEGPRIAPHGTPAAGLMILVDMPDQADLTQGDLLCGQAGMLFDRMLGAIGRDRASIYLASVTPTRPTGGRIPRSETIFEAAKHHAVLAAPRAILLVGETACRALLGIGHVEARGRIHEINHGGATIAAVATIHPRDLLRNAGRKADAWRDLRLLTEVLNR